jgi:NADH-ubiquinone oxidoreductase chain 5
MNHAFFKALLFLSAGSVIHALLDEQDMRKMGGLLKLMPYTYAMFVIGSLALMGFPFTTGFYSKDVILELAYSNYYVEGIFAYWLGVLGACCTAFYSYRLIYITFLSETNISKAKVPYIHDVPFFMGLPLFILSLGSIFVGYIFKDMFIGVGTPFWGNSIYTYNNLNDILLLEAEFLSCYEFCNSQLFFISKTKLGYFVYSFFNKKWFFDVIYNYYLVQFILNFGYNITFKLLDRGVIELLGPTGLVRSFSSLNVFLKKMQSGFVFNYIFGMVLSLFCIVFLLLDFVFINNEVIALLLISSLFFAKKLNIYK